MLGWMLKRGDNTPDAAGAEDTTLAEIPDTPAPVFVARAFKGALFGTPRDDNRRPRKTATMAPTNQQSQTPNSKPQGILLTPGTGTTRQKRVSFGRDVQGASRPNKSTGDEPLARTRLNGALEKAKQQKPVGDAQLLGRGQKQREPSDDEWEDAMDEDGADQGNPDATVDLSEPHSESGKYWKAEFEKYRSDAKAEMEKLLKYKQLAKLYTQQKDAEAIELAEKLKEEQKKVMKMEKKIAENASTLMAQHENAPEEEHPELLSKLTKQTALAVKYRQRVDELEGQLEDFLEQRQGSSEMTASETQRELRRARSQLMEMDGLREQVAVLKTQLKTAEKRAAKAEVGLDPNALSTERATSLKAQLRESKEQSRKKDDEIRRLREEFEQFRKEKEKEDQERNDILEAAQAKIATQKKEIQALKATASERHTQQAKRSQGHADLAPHGERIAQENMSPRAAGNRPSSTSKALENDDLEAAISGELGYSARPRDTIPQYRTLREKFHDDATYTSAVPDPGQTDIMSGALGGRPLLQKPTRQISAPSSPRNPAYLRETTDRIHNGGITSTATRPKSTNDPGLSTFAHPPAQRTPRYETNRHGDVLHSRGAASDNHFDPSRVALAPNEAKSKLPPARRAAAMARIEKRRAEKLKARAGDGFDKENVRP